LTKVFGARFFKNQSKNAKIAPKSSNFLLKIVKIATPGSCIGSSGLNFQIYELQDENGNDMGKNPKVHMEVNKARYASILIRNSMLGPAPWQKNKPVLPTADVTPETEQLSSENITISEEEETNSEKSFDSASSDSSSFEDDEELNIVPSGRKPSTTAKAKATKPSENILLPHRESEQLLQRERSKRKPTPSDSPFLRPKFCDMRFIGSGQLPKHAGDIARVYDGEHYDKSG
jgi:hypothetical protein